MGDNEERCGVDIEPFLEYLDVTRRSSAAALAFMHEALGIAVAIEDGTMSTYDVAELPDGSLASFLLEQYRWSVPAGIAQRRAENEEIEHQMDEEEIDKIVQYFGMLFVFNLPTYLRYLAKAQKEFRGDLKDAMKICQITDGCKPPEF